MKKITACALLLTAATCTVGVLTTTGETQAHYVNRAGWLTVAEPAQKTTEVSSDSLQTVDAPPLVNLLGQLPQEGCEIPITLSGSENRFGQLIWSTDCPTALEVGMRIGSRELRCGDLVGVTTNTPTRLILKLKPVEGASLPETAVNVHVSWGDTLSGTFRGEWKTEEPVQKTAAKLKAPAFLSANGILPIGITPETTGKIVFGLTDGEDLAPFPAGTKYSPDQGKIWYRLTGEDVISLNTEPENKNVLLLDLCQTQLAQGQTVTVADQMGSKVTVQATSQPDYILSGRILTQDRPITVGFSEALREGQLTYTLERLTLQGEKADYLPVTFQGLRLETDEKGEKLLLSIGDVLPQPGTYRLRLSRSYENVTYWETSIPFFINYTEESIQTGGAEQ